MPGFLVIVRLQRDNECVIQIMVLCIALIFMPFSCMQGMLLMHILSMCDLVIHMIPKMQPFCIRIILVHVLFNFVELSFPEN